MTTIILLFFAGMLNGVMDVISHNYSASIFNKFPKLENYCNPVYSWRNKYKKRNPDKGPLFFGSTTFLAFLTDLWHMSKTLMLILIMIAICSYTPLLGIFDILLFYLVFTSSFELFYSYILK